MDAEKYGHEEMSNDELEARIAADLYELSNRLKDTDAKVIGNLLWQMMSRIREAYRTARLVLGGDAP